MSRFFAWIWPALATVCLVHCAARAPQRPIRPGPANLPDEALVYLTDPRSDAASEGGAPELAADVAAELAKRGDKAVADGALTAAAIWLLNEALQRREVGTTVLESASRHFGFAGVVTGLALFEADKPESWREWLATVPKNMAINRFGVCTSPSGRQFAVIYGRVTLQFEPISRFIDPGATMRLRGEVDGRYATAQVFLTKPDGTVEEHPMPARKLDFSAALATPGRYKLEIMGDGPTGPEIISNVPVFVGIQEPRLTELGGKPVSAAETEARMLELLNQVRVKNRLRPVQADPELRQVALGHSMDMADHAFFAHVSPTTGTTLDRVKRSGILLSDAGENIAQSTTPEAAHDQLMDSPGHRTVMLGPSYTHVGIAAVAHDAGVIVTLLFGRRPDPTKLPRDPAQVEAAILSLRAAKGLSAPTVDTLYRYAAQRGVQAFLKASKPTNDIAFSATQDALRSESRRVRAPRPAGAVCTLFVELAEVEQLELIPGVLAPGLLKFGLGAQAHTDDKGTRLATVIVLEGAPCNDASR